MEENREKTGIEQEIRDSEGKFLPGISGNPDGRPKGSRSFTTKVREALEKIADGKDYTYEEAFIKSILKKAIVDGDSQIMRLIWNYLDGMPSNSLDITTAGEKLNKELTSEDLDNLVAIYGRNKQNRISETDNG